MDFIAENLGTVVSISRLQPEKVASGMWVRPSGRLAQTRPAQSLNTPMPSSGTLVPKYRLVRSVLEKA